MLLAIVLGAAPAAWMGLELAWIVVALGSTVLLLAPWLARRQVRSITGIRLPAVCTVHAGKTVPISVRMDVAHSARMLLVALVGPGDSKAVRDRAPRTLITALAPARGPSAASEPPESSLELPLRASTRGRWKGLELAVQSSYPFGLVTAYRSLPAPIELTALPRLLPERDLGLQRAMSQLAGLSDEDRQWRVTRGEGLPSGLRDLRPGDSKTQLHLRASLRRQRWTAMERPELGAELAEVTLHRPLTGPHPSRRVLAAFEAATSMTASVVRGLHEMGLSVDLGTLDRLAEGDAEPRHPRRALGRSKSTLRHLQSLTDVSLDPVEAGSSERAPRNRAAVAMTVELIPTTSPIVMEAEGEVQARERGACRRLRLFVDANGRVSQRSSQR
jgi:uncharacterized protein (DUF58 family)